MELKVVTPTEIILSCPVQKITIEGIDGFRCFLPKHIDFITALKPGIMTYLTQDNKLKYVACNQGLFVKCGNQVSVSTPWAVISDNLEHLKQHIKQAFQEMEQERKEVGVSMARLEIGLTKGLMQLRREESHVIL
ncbi:MAG: F0F1 ATP synthase subunit epsilon [Alphaproteobacteria bacterium]|nr:F0F1 ATP synthase subunit epsilon [Alphaproteobacteria bacterium]